MKKIVLHVFLIVTGVLTLIPFIWMLSAAFMQDGHANVFPPRFFPDKITFEQFYNLFSKLNVGRKFFNSLILSFSVTIISLFLNSMADLLLLNIALKVKINYSTFY